MTRKKYINIGPRLTPVAADWYGNNFKTVNSGVEMIIMSFPNLFDRTLEELKGHFTEKEIRFLFDVWEFEDFNFEKAGYQLKAKVQYAIEIKIHEPWSVKADEILAKIDRLTLVDRAWIEIWLAKYWKKYMGSRGVDDYIEIFCKPAAN